jgi:hypothetical protein
MIDENGIHENDAGKRVDWADEGHSEYGARLLEQLAKRGLDDLDVTDEAMILLASTQLGADEASIAEKLEFCFDDVAGVGARLRAGGVWVDDRVAHAERWKGCLMMFMLDILVAAGDLDCRHEHGQPIYRPKNRDALETLLTIVRPDHVRSHPAAEIQNVLEQHGVCLDTDRAQRWLREAYDQLADLLRRYPEIR